MRYQDQVALITGAAHGIGAETARRLHQEGGTVVVADHDLEAARRMQDDLGERSLAVGCDVHDTTSVDGAVETVRDRFGRLDQLVAVAGGSAPMPVFEDQSDALWQDLIDLNLTGVMRCIRAAIPLLRDSDRAAVVMVSSVNGIAAFGEEAYGAAKAGLTNLAQNLTVRYGPEQIRFNVVAPGTIRTRVWDHQPGSEERLRKLYPLGRIGEPADVAAAIAFLGSPDAGWISGITLPVDGGGTAGPLQFML